MTMPELTRWFRFLSARLRHVRILNGNWARVCTSGVLKALSVRQGGHAGIFLDPPYADTANRTAALYTEDSLSVAHDVREWAIANGDDPRYRIVLAGYAEEHPMPETWRVVEWYRAGFLKGGMKNTGDADTQQTSERLWLSPHCLAVEPIAEARQGDLFGAVLT